MRDDITPVLISCQQRHHARSITLPQLHSVGIHPRVFLDHCQHDPTRTGLHAGEIGNKWVAQRALAWAVKQSKPILFLEDDIDPAEDFLTGVRAALESGGTTYLYVNESEDRMRDIYGPELATRLQARTPTPVTATRALTYSGLFGAQAVLIPNAHARLVLETIPKARKAIDAALQSALTRHHLPAFVITPNVVQHRHDRTCREPEEYAKRSTSFDCPRGPP